MQPTRKLAAILSSDVFGYSRLMADDDRATLEAIDKTRQIMGRHIAQHDGRVVDATGDALLAEFASALEAVLCARAIQHELAQVNSERPEHRQMHLRIGLNLGDVLENDGALYGDGVNIAARIQTAGEPGGVCISASIHEQVQDKLPLHFEPASEQHFKNIGRPVKVYHVRGAGEGRTPVHGAVAKIEANLRAPRTNLSRPLSSFVGRTSEVAAVRKMLGQQRLVTLLGTGGIGKTRLALEVAAKLLPHYPDGVWLVELAGLADARLLPQAVASVLRIKATPGGTVIDAVLAALEHAHMLIVLDNCEHLLQACAALVRQMLQAGARVKVLVTSREHLHVTGEASYPVPPLLVPDPRQPMPFEVALRHEAVQLFASRADTGQRAFELTPGNMAAVVDICHRLDGIPLAIELAAARTRALSVENIAARLSDRFHLLTRGDPNAMPRQQTLRALIDWSHDLLTEAERALFRRLAVFAGGWTLESAEAVGAADASEVMDVPDLLGRLVDRSMVEAIAGGKRYRLLQTVRQYAQDWLDESGEAEAVRDRHLGFFLTFAEAASAELAGPQQRDWLSRIDVEQENIIAAHAWCDHAKNGAEAGLRLMFAVKLYLFNRGMIGPLRLGMLDALARPGAASRSIYHCRALHTVGQVGFLMGRFAEAKTQLEEALAIAQELRDTGRAASVLQTLGMTCLGQGDLTAAHHYLERALALARQRGDRRELAGALNALAQLHRIDGNADAAAPLYEEGLRLTRDLGDRESTAVALLNLTMLAIGGEERARAVDLLLEALEIAEAIGSKPTGGNVLAVLSGLAALCGDWRSSVWFDTAAKQQMKQTGIQLDPVDEAFLAPFAAAARQGLTPEDSLNAEAATHALPYAEAMAAAREWLAGRVEG